MSIVKIHFDPKIKVNTGVFDNRKTSVTFTGLARNDKGEIVQAVHVVGGDTLIDDVMKIVETFDEKVQKELHFIFFMEEKDK